MDLAVKTFDLTKRFGTLTAVDMLLFPACFLTSSRRAPWIPNNVDRLIERLKGALSSPSYED